MSSTADGDDVCESCAEHDYWRCSECERLIREYDPCDECDSETSDLIHDYCYKPRPEFHGAGPVFLGLELETSVSRWHIEDSAEIAVEMLGDLGYLKEDCSLDQGFEIVTHPMSYAWAMANFPWEMLSELSRSSCEATHDAGMHVHISRTAFESPSHAFRWMKFLYRNAASVIGVARRESDQWASWRPNDRSQVKEYAKGVKGFSRYSAINTQNDATFELRIFASTLEPQEVKAALGLADASVEYTRNLTVADIAQRDGWDWSSFSSWLAQRPEYAPLMCEMEALCAS
ncbi:hypothetical protein [Allokutzneria sp. NRRL B-24872]|uniref:hypothetical protein n=1 Tax=Allokutzneria sp. NRRL B-24872 TaxID=1137961 RepID=UPI001FEE0A84|nr:hypothetical protein [Allokutzneria sp. NRRL B-24872]